MKSSREENSQLSLEVDYLKKEISDYERKMDEFRKLQIDHAAILNSTSWRITRVPRLLATEVHSLIRNSRKLKTVFRIFIDHCRAAGITASTKKVYSAIKHRGFLATLNQAVSPHVNLYTNFALSPPTKEAGIVLARSVLLISEVSIPQCLKYRVIQKQRMIESLGYNCQYLDWRDNAACMTALQTCGTVIFYRVPAFPDVLNLISEARRLRVISYWEVDDLIFDPDKYRQNSNLKVLDAGTVQSLMEGVHLYRKAMLACDRAIASTTGLAGAMHEAGVHDVAVIENALDEETIQAADNINQELLNIPKDSNIRIVYGSGTKTHDADFLEAAGAIYSVMKKRPNVLLRIIGELTIPDIFSDIQGRIEKVPFSDYPKYLRAMAECDISIAPLEASMFNDAKSNIKYLEASSVMLPSVCSPRAAFSKAIDHLENGFLANSEEEWEAHLSALIDDPMLRAKIGHQARLDILSWYSPEKIAGNQVIAILPPIHQATKRVLSVNIFFSPRSFGGATIVAEQMSRLLGDDSSFEQYVFTSVSPETFPPYSLVRYGVENSTVFGVALPDQLDALAEFDNPSVTNAFNTVLKQINPDIVHFHSIQGLGVSLAQACQVAGIPYIVTLHDAWWICGRQFMINNRGVYCGQRKIDLDVCAKCVVNPALNKYRQRRLKDVLSCAERLLVPSQFTLDLYRSNGFPLEAFHINKNGIKPPRVSYQKKPSDVIRFGYVGGNTPIKGVHLILSAFNKIQRSDYQLIIVDNLLNLGRQSFDANAINVPGKVEILPGYNQENIDGFFENIDVLLFPTQWKETFGLTIREALIRDVWVISTDAGGTVEDIVEGENGTIIPLSNDDQYLVKAIEGVLEDQRKFANYSNPYKSKISLFQDQANDLKITYRKLIAQHVSEDV